MNKKAITSEFIFDEETESSSMITSDESQPELLWQKCLEIIRDNVSPQIFKTWFEPITALRWENNQLTIQVPSQFFYEWLEEHYYELLQKTLAGVISPKARLQYQVVVDRSQSSSEQRTIRLPAFRQPPPAQTALPFGGAPEAPSAFPNFLNPRYTFENFITGESNQLAAAAARAIAENPGKTRYNPFVLYGDTGLGKTHLVQAIGNYALQRNRNLRVIYTNSERFTMEYVNAIQNNKVNEFTNFYRSVDILIVDDIQFFSGKEKTQDNFFHSFNVLHQAGKQIILTSDKPPKELVGVDERLISRFQWGLTADVQAPDFEMRMAILQRKAQDEGSEMPGEIIEYLARRLTGNVREMEGCLIRLLAKVSLDGRDISIELAKEVVGDVTGVRSTAEMSIPAIVETTAEYFTFTTEPLIGKSRRKEIVFARQIAMFLCKELTGASLKAIGNFFGGRDHTTVMHSCTVVRNCIDTRHQPTINALRALTNKLGDIGISF